MLNGSRIEKIDRVTCVYHDADFDGICSAAIVNHWCQEQKIPVDFIGADYNRLPADLPTDHAVIMVDFSLPVEQMRKLPLLVWIDHHKTAMEAADQAGFNPSGRRDTKKAGCELTWEFLFPNHAMPDAVQLLGRWDVWDHANPEVEPFQFGMRSMRINGPTDDEWFPLLLGVSSEVNKILSRGRVVCSHLDGTYRIIGRLAHTLPEGWFLPSGSEVSMPSIPTVALNVPVHGSPQFKYCPRPAALLVAYGYNGTQWKVSLYAGPDAPADLDCGAIAKVFGGGGHKGAAGFHCDRLPWGMA
jgi:hypothetical protein